VGLGGSGAGSSAAAGSSGSSNAGAAGTTGGTTDGGSGGSATGGGGSGGTGASLGCSSAKICEDFEKDLDMSTWTLRMSGGFTAKIDTDQFHSGSHSLHVVAPNTTNNAWLTEKKTFPAADFWGRAWYRISGPKGGHQEYIIAPAAGNELRIFNRKTDSEMMGLNTQSPDKWYLTNTPVPQATWFCYEFHVTETATTLYPNGKEATEVKPPGMKGVTALSFGWQRWQTGGGPGEMWIDDIAVGDKQIGCE
jgi:hypothetical protein